MYPTMFTLPKCVIPLFEFSVDKQYIISYITIVFCRIHNSRVCYIFMSGGMKNERWNISEQELRRAIKMMKENKATDESGMIAEY